MDAAVVGGRLDVVRHVGRLWILAQLRVVVGRSRAPSSSAALHLDTASASRPAPISQSACSAVCPSAYCLTSEPKTSDIDSFSAPGLLPVVEVGVVLGDAVGQLVADHVDGDREAVEELPSPSPKTIRCAVPEGVVVPLAVVDDRVATAARRRRSSRAGRSASRGHGWRRGRRTLRRPPHLRSGRSPSARTSVPGSCVVSPAS